jgi:hypothetical protein
VRASRGGAHRSTFHHVDCGAAFGLVRSRAVLVRAYTSFGDLFAAVPGLCGRYGRQLRFLDVLAEWNDLASRHIHGIAHQIWDDVAEHVLGYVNCIGRTTELAADRLAAYAEGHGIAWTLAPSSAAVAPRLVLEGDLQFLLGELLAADDDDGEAELHVLFFAHDDSEVVFFTSQEALANYAVREGFEYDLRAFPLEGRSGDGFGFPWQLCWISWYTGCEEEEDAGRRVRVREMDGPSLSSSLQHHRAAAA